MVPCGRTCLSGLNGRRDSQVSQSSSRIPSCKHSRPIVYISIDNSFAQCGNLCLLSHQPPFGPCSCSCHCSHPQRDTCEHMRHLVAPPNWVALISNPTNKVILHDPFGAYSISCHRDSFHSQSPAIDHPLDPCPTNSHLAHFPTSSQTLPTTVSAISNEGADND